MTSDNPSINSGQVPSINSRQSPQVGQLKTNQQISSFEELEALSDSARLWIFQSSRKLNGEEKSVIQNHLNTFLEGWTSHNRELLAKGVIAFDHFVIIVLDESNSSDASGCSIDNMTHQIQALSNHLNIDLMNRTTFYFLIEGSIKGIQMNELSGAVEGRVVEDSTLVFNNLIQQKSDLKSNWLIPVSESWHKRFL